MNPRTHPRGAPPDFALPRPNPNPQRMTDALWWLVCMRELLEPERSENGGTYAKKPGSHNIGLALPDHGPGDPRTDHSIRNPKNRRGPWWQSKCAAHDWTFLDAQKGDFTTIKKYTGRLIASMRDPNDPRPDDVVFYTLGQADNDRAVEGWNERDDGPESSGDLSHAWHRHDSLWRDVVGSFPHIWQLLTIDMGWSVPEWRASVEPVGLLAAEEEIPVDQATFNELMDGWAGSDRGKLAIGQAVKEHKIRIIGVKNPDGTGVVREIGTVLSWVDANFTAVQKALAKNADPTKVAAALLPLILAGLPAGAGPVDQATLEAALRNVLGSLDQS